MDGVPSQELPTFSLQPNRISQQHRLCSLLPMTASGCSSTPQQQLVVLTSSEPTATSSLWMTAP
jgi:hypothetical protein